MEHELLFRLIPFAIIFFLMVIWEILAPKKQLIFGKKRWPANILIVVLDAIIMRLILPFGAVGAAIWAESNGIGLLSLLEVPSFIIIMIAVVLLDLIIYSQHVIFHAVPVLWRLHQVHHADQDIDVTTGLRFHPVEILVSMFIKLAAVVMLGVPALAVIIFEVILNGMAMFNHSNIRLPKAIDSLLRLVLITPDVHRVHHSVVYQETNSNYGFNLSVWDRLFGTYKAQPELGHDQVVIGLPEYQHSPTYNLSWMLRLPFQSKVQANNPVNKA